MKFFTLPLALIISLFAQGQVLVSQNQNQTPHPSAQLEARSENKGFLPPVLNTRSRRNIVNPAEGLLVFDSTKQKMFVYTRGGWKSFAMGEDSIDIATGVQLSNPGFSNGEQAGYRVEIDGDYAYLGAWASNVNSKSQQGAVYIYHYENGIWNYQSKVVAADGEAFDNFGNDIALSQNYVFISSSGDGFGSNSAQGSVYIYKWSNGGLVFQNKITGSDATAGDRFGFEIEAERNLLIVGAVFDDIGLNTNQGSVYFYELEGEAWVEKQKYFAQSNTGTNDLFGKGIFINSNFVVIGCDFLNTPGNYGYNRNRVTVLTRANGTGSWVLHGEILNPSGQNFEAFGYSNTIEDDIVTISASMRDVPSGNKDRGTVYVFKRNQNSWNLIQTLAPTDPNIGDVFGDYFGSQVDRYGDYLLIGASHEDAALNNRDLGAAFLYKWDGTQFNLVKKLQSPTPQLLEWFGMGISIYKEKILIGAPGKSSNSGGAYFFEIQ